MRYRLLAADDRLLRDAFADLLGPSPAMREIEAKDPFTGQVRRATVPVATVDTELILTNSWETDSPTRLVERALGCTANEASAELELVREAEDWTLMAISEAATSALTSASKERLGGYAIDVEPGQRLYVFWEG